VTALSFALALALSSLAAGTLVSALTAPLGPLVARLSPARRADLALWMGLLPAWVAAGVGIAVALPSAVYGLGLGPDHCDDHVHHGHLCWFHGTALPPSIALLAATATGLVLVRLASVIAELARSERLARSLASLGRADGPVIRVPSELPLCHAAGVLSPRILLADAVERELTAEELRGALAHERAHLTRRDTAWSAALELAGAVSAPWVGRAWRQSWRQAAEEAADSAAAAQTSSEAVASALVKVARLRLPPALGLGFGETGLEPRIRRLLGTTPVLARSASGLGVTLLLLACVAVVAGGHEALHHAVESLWHELDTTY
jgi:hypothetical protein